jgi:hypothetical protein
MDIKIHYWNEVQLLKYYVYLHGISSGDFA